MKQIMNIDLLKENPQLFFSKLPDEAEIEIQNLLEFVFFKYNLNNLYGIRKNIDKDKFNLFKENPIRVEKITKYTREELHER